MIGELQRTAILGLILAAVATAAGVYHFAKVAGLEGTIETQAETITAQSTKIGTLESTVTTLESSLRTALDANAGLEEAVKVQQAAIDRMKKDAADRAARAAKALQEARAEYAELKKKYDGILQQPPADPENMCRSLDIRLQQYIDTRQQEAQQ